MNGSWMAYGLKPEIYVSTFRSLANAVRANPQANETYMVWAPNIAGGDVDGLEGYSQYYPGEEYVDIAGLSFYFSGEDKTQNTMPAQNEFRSGFQSFYDLYGDRHKIVITETSAARHYYIPDDYQQQGIDTEVYNIPPLSSLTPIPATGSADELDMKSNWMQQLTGPQTAGR